MRRPIIVGNWKMYKTAGETERELRELRKKLDGVITDVEVAVCPPFTALESAQRSLKGSSIGLGAQNMHWESEGAFTGEISAPMLLDVGCKFVILGHSERRQYFGETDERINRKIVKAFESGLFPILCVGETLEQREKNATKEVCGRQVAEGLKNVPKARIPDLVIAYEPVWAIGTGKTASPEDAQEVVNFIRETLKQLYDVETASNVRIQYGGSVKPENISELMAQQDIDGALVGGASLKADLFAGIVLYGK